MRPLSGFVAALWFLCSLPAHSTILRFGLNGGIHLPDPESPQERQVFEHAPHFSVLLQKTGPRGAFHVGIGYEGRHGGNEYRPLDPVFSIREIRSVLAMDYWVFPIGFQIENRQSPRARPFIAMRFVPSVLHSAKISATAINQSGEKVTWLSSERDVKDDMNPIDVMGELEGGLSFPLPKRMGPDGPRLLAGFGVGYGFINALKDNPGDNDLNSLVLRASMGIEF